MKKTSILICILILCLLTGCSDTKKENDFTKDFIPALENSDLNLKLNYESEKELHLIGANVDSFTQCIDLLKGIGYVFDTEQDSLEESMIHMQLWKGTNEQYSVSLCLVLDIHDNTGASDYIRINYNPLTD